MAFVIASGAPERLETARHLVPGEPWQEAIEEALDRSRTCAVSRFGHLGPWQNEDGG